MQVLMGKTYPCTTGPAGKGLGLLWLIGFFAGYLISGQHNPSCTVYPLVNCHNYVENQRTKWTFSIANCKKLPEANWTLPARHPQEHRPVLSKLGLPRLDFRGPPSTSNFRICCHFPTASCGRSLGYKHVLGRSWAGHEHTYNIYILYILCSQIWNIYILLLLYIIYKLYYPIMISLLN
jgi:hypothetical protein